MTQVTELQTKPVTSVSAAVKDRRRPGRTDDVSPELIPMLRNDTPLPLDLEDVDQAAALRGLCFGIVLSIPLWVGIAYVGSLFLS